MDVRRIGRSVRALRRRLGWRQVDLANRVGVSQSTISWLERGHAGGLSLRAIDRIASALDADVSVWLRWRGGDLDRLLDEAHARLGEVMAARLASLGWTVVPEVTYSIYGERGSIDLLAFHPGTGSLLVIELKTEIVSIEETLRKHDAKVRLAPRIARERFGWNVSSTSRLLVVRDRRSDRRRVTKHAHLLERVYPVRTVEMKTWLRRPTGPSSALMFVPDTDHVGRRRGSRQGGGTSVPASSVDQADQRPKRLNGVPDTDLIDN